MHLTLRGARLVDAAGERRGDLTLRDGAIAAGGADGAVLELGGALVTPGFVDVHTHGGGGHDLHTTDADAIRAYAAWAPSTGTTAFLAGVVGVPGGPPEEQLAAAVEAAERPGPGAEALGVHLEGPYINPLRRGAHDPSWLRLPAPAETARVLAIAGRWLRLATVAPELPGAPELIRTLAEAGVTVSIGHTDADYEQTRAALPLGITHATHCFNAMRPLLHRAPGPLGAIVEAAGVRGELIADGVHVHPAAMRALVRALGPERVVGVTDALAAAGAHPGGEYAFAGQPARVAGGAMRLRDGTLTGSVLTMDRALRNLLALAGVALPDAVGMLSLNPARAAGVGDRKGALRPGYDADVLVWDEGLALGAAFCRGELAWATDAWRARLGAPS